MSELLLDTCAVIWTAIDDQLNTDIGHRLTENYNTGCRTCVSPVSAWELGMLTARGKIRLERPLTRWFDEYINLGQISLVEMSPRILIESSYLPGTPPSDPADRILIATARMLSLQIVTRDRAILEYADKGYVQALRC